MLIALTKEYLDLVLEWRNQANVRENMYSSHKITREEHVNWFAKIREDPSKRYFLFQHHNQLCGVIYFDRLLPFAGQATWGFYGAPDAPPGNGLRMELAALEYAFRSLKLHKLNCEVIATNRQVINLHLKTGFVEEGRFRDYFYDGSKFQDVVRLGIVEGEFPSARTRLCSRIAKLTEDEL